MNAYSRNAVRNYPVQEMPRGESATVYRNVDWGRSSPVNTVRLDVWIALFFLALGGLITPIDLPVGAVVGIPALAYLMAAARSVKIER